jgi:hypothetical protein
LLRRLLRSRKAVSPAISTVIITGTIVVLVLVAYTYVFQALERQSGNSEFEIAKKGILAFDDAVENVAWKPLSSRSTRFVANYGAVELVPNALNFNVTAYAGGNSCSFSNLTGVVKYFTGTEYVTYGNNFKEYILGNESTVVSGSTGKLGQVVVEQQARWINITLSYRVLAMKTSEMSVGAQYMTYIDIQMIRINISKRSSFTGEFDLNAKCSSVTLPVDPKNSTFPVSSGTIGLVSARFGTGQTYSWTTPPLRQGNVTFNFLLSNVEVTV